VPGPLARGGTLATVGFYGEQIVPRLTDLALSGRPFDCLRARVTADLEGEVLEIGFGSGRNLPHYPPTVTRVRAVEPSGVGRKLAAGRVAASPVPVEFVGLDGQELPIEDASVDHVLTTWTLCTIPDVARALHEVRRVLNPGGSLHFVEHGRAPYPRVARWQDRLTPIQRRVAGGCHLNRPIDELVAASGLVLQRLDHPTVPGPRAFTYTYEGVATRR
jgi:SAM-dependent methyltransferase